MPCLALKITVDPQDVVSLAPPLPDIECQFVGGSHYFELAEIIHENVAAALSPKDWITSPKPFLPELWGPLWTVLQKKLRKPYSSEARPRSLLLYYDQSPSCWGFLDPIVKERSAEIETVLRAANSFDHLFLFDLKERKSLTSFSVAPFLYLKE